MFKNLSKKNKIFVFIGLFSALISFFTYSIVPLIFTGALYLLFSIPYQNYLKGDTNLSNYAEYDITSYPNRPRILEGKKWSNIEDIINHNKTIATDRALFLDEFKISSSTPLSFYNYAINEASKRFKSLPKAKIDKLDTTKTQLIIGSTGSGKTVTVEDYLLQNRDNSLTPSYYRGDYKIWNRELIIDYKGTFSSKFFREGEDIIYNAYDKRSSSWNIWLELEYHPTVITAFLNGIVMQKNGGGDKSKFFTGTASQTLEKKAFQTAIKYQELSIYEKWTKFIEELELWIEKESNPQGNESLAKTLALCLPPLKLLCYQSSKAKKFFTLEEDFFSKNNVSIFLGNNEKYKTDLEPIVAGFIDTCQLIMLGRPETKTDLTLFLLEEAKRLNLLNLAPLLTGGRGRGASVIMLVQYLDYHKKDEVSLILSSIEILMIFTIGDIEANELTKLLGEVKYIEENISSSSNSSYSGDSSGSSRSEGEKKEAFISSTVLQQIPKNYHISLIKSKGLNYLGQSNFIEIPIVGKELDEIDLKDLNLFKYFYREWLIKQSLGSTLNDINAHLKSIKNDDELSEEEKEQTIIEFLSHIELPQEVQTNLIFDI